MIHRQVDFNLLISPRPRHLGSLTSSSLSTNLTQYSFDCVRVFLDLHTVDHLIPGLIIRSTFILKSSWARGRNFFLYCMIDDHIVHRYFEVIRVGLSGSKVLAKSINWLNRKSVIFA